MKKNIITIFVLIFIAVIGICLVGLHIFTIRKNITEELKYYLSNSNVVNKQMGEIKNINVIGVGFEKKYKKLEGNNTYINCLITTKEKKRKKIKIIFNNEVTGGIYAYEIDKKIYYESIKTNQPIINKMKESKILKENLENIMYIYRPQYATYKNYKDNYYACNFIVIINNEKSKNIKVIVDNNSSNIYAYEIDGRVIYEDNENEY